MSLRPVLHYPDPELRIVSSPVDLERVKSGEYNDLIEEMIETMKLENGIGIAAPQIGVKERVIIVDMPDAGPTAFFNPEILEKSFKMIDSEEGCLSVPGVWGLVKRHRSVKVRLTDKTGKTTEERFNELYSTVFQHEIDHLDGVLFIDKAYKSGPLK